MQGYDCVRLGEGMYDPRLAQAIVLEGGAGRIATVALDLESIPRNDVDAARRDAC